MKSVILNFFSAIYHLPSTLYLLVFAERFALRREPCAVSPLPFTFYPVPYTLYLYFPSSIQRLLRLQRLIQIFDQIFGIFQPHRQAY
jgi:hypothetical protein